MDSALTKLSISELPQFTVLAFIEGLVIEKSHRVAEEILAEAGEISSEPPWPSGRCVETSLDLREVLRERWPRMGADFIYGTFTILDRRFDHAWVELRNESIIDITAGQFFPGQPAESTMFILPTDRLAEHYTEVEKESPMGGEPMIPEIRREEGCLVGSSSPWTKRWVRPRLRQAIAKLRCAFFGHRYGPWTCDDYDGPGEHMEGGGFMPYCSREALPGEWGMRLCDRYCGLSEHRWPEAEAPLLWKDKLREQEDAAARRLVTLAWRPR